MAEQRPATHPGFDGSVVIVGVMRDVAPHLGGVLANVANVASWFADAHAIFVESDSSDGTDDLLRRMQSELSFEVHTLGALTPSMPLRTQRIAHARNTYLERVEQDFADRDYLFILDCDETGTDSISRDVVSSNFTFDWDMVTANHAHRYYDLWALRHPIWMPFDCWQMLRNNDFMLPQDAYDFFIGSRFLHLAPHLPPIRVQSAFGGAAMVRIDRLDGARHSHLNDAGEEMCEWVSFCSHFDDVFINPAFVAQSTPSEHVTRQAPIA